MHGVRAMRPLCVQLAQVSSGHSAVADQFCFLAMSALIHQMRRVDHAYDQYTVIDNHRGHVTDDEIMKLLRDEIGVRFAGESTYTSSLPANLIANAVMQIDRSID